MVDPAHKAEPSCPQERARGKLDSERRRAGDEGARGGARRRGWETRPGEDGSSPWHLRLVPKGSRRGGEAWGAETPQSARRVSG